MPRPPLRITADPNRAIGDGLRALRDRLELPDRLPPEVLAAAEAAVRQGGLADGRTRSDRTDVPFVTIDPTGSTDLDQALWIGPRPGGGHRVLYAIADVAAFVTVGDAVDREARRRGTTVYLPDGRIPLHPEVISEHAASLRAGQDRPALVWEIALDGDGIVVDVHVERSVVRSRAELDYATVQRALDDRTAEDPLVELRVVGLRREAIERDRGGVSLPLPDQEVVVGPRGTMSLEFRSPLPIEGWNAQISLLTGMAAAQLMLDAGVGILRTLPPPDESTLASLRADAAALDVAWPARASYAEVVRGLDASRPEDAAFATQAARLFRGAGYLSFDERSRTGSPAGGPPSHGASTAGVAPVGSEAEHAAVAAPYSHVTAPLRRLVDRFANEVVLAIVAGEPPPDDVRGALEELPALMASARRRESSADGGARDVVEHVLLAARAGRPLHAVVVDVDDDAVRVQIADPAVLTRVALGPDGPSPRPQLGSEITVVPDEDGTLVPST